jgi:hypothetical protein
MGITLPCRLPWALVEGRVNLNHNDKDPSSLIPVWYLVQSASSIQIVDVTPSINDEDPPAVSVPRILEQRLIKSQRHVGS